MSKVDVKDYICRPYCRFFKEGEKEEMECRGAIVIEELVKNKKLTGMMIPADGKDETLWNERHPSLVNHVCSRCEFRIGGCDYMSDNPPPDAEPCGGNILLALLLKQGIITDLDLKDIYDC